METKFWAATPRQIKWLADLADQRELGLTREQMIAEIAKQNLSTGGASKWIRLALMKPEKPAQPKLVPDELPPAEIMPAGRYAVDVPGDGALAFFVIDRPTEGRWAGGVFVKQLASDTEHPVKGDRRTVVLRLIAHDPMAAALRYGREIGRCCICGKVLTDFDSRALGIGPVCGQRMKW